VVFASIKAQCLPQPRHAACFSYGRCYQILFLARLCLLQSYSSWPISFETAINSVQGLLCFVNCPKFMHRNVLYFLVKIKVYSYSQDMHCTLCTLGYSDLVTRLDTPAKRYQVIFIKMVVKYVSLG
jgi:hypothetical protein